MPKPRRYVTSPLPAWSKKIQHLREELQLTQSGFAKKLHCSSMTVSRWERGLVKPTANSLIAMGDLAGPHGGMHFWRIAGISPEAVKRMLGADQKKSPRKPRPR
jgi:transcriptional regulator with XRE-family HTH domain